MLYVYKHSDGTKTTRDIKHRTNKAYNHARQSADNALGMPHPEIEKLTRRHEQEQQRKAQWWLYLPKPDPVERDW